MYERHYVWVCEGMCLCVYMSAWVCACTGQWLQYVTHSCTSKCVCLFPYVCACVFVCVSLTEPPGWWQERSWLGRTAEQFAGSGSKPLAHLRCPHSLGFLYLSSAKEKTQFVKNIEPIGKQILSSTTRPYIYIASTYAKLHWLAPLA